MLLPLLLLACTPEPSDRDGDRLVDEVELTLGTDPDDPDSDGDGLADGDEVEVYGSDPRLVDSDGDHYRDGDEVFEGTDPTDAGSRIYEGYWPYYRDKEELAEGPWDAIAEPGDRVPRLRTFDQHGDDVDLYDFAGEGRPTLLHYDAMW